MNNIKWHRIDQIYLQIDPPYPDETYSSFVNRAACFYGMGPTALLNTLSKDQQKILFVHYMANGWDEANVPIRQTIRRAFTLPFDTEPVSINRHDQNFIVPAERHCYCVLCFWEDVVAGRTPHFRRMWARTARTYCDNHRCPLVAGRFGPNAEEWWKHPWCKAASRKRRPKDPVYDELRALAEEYRYYSLNIDSEWPGRAVSQRLCDWESRFDENDKDWYVCKLIYWLAHFSPKDEGTVPRRWKEVRHMSPSKEGWQFGEVSIVRREPWPAIRADSLHQLRAIGDPQTRRALFFLALCCFEKDVPIQELGIWPKKMKSATEAWWHWIMWHRLGEWHGEFEWLYRFGQLANCDFSCLRESAYLSQLQL